MTTKNRKRLPLELADAARRADDYFGGFSLPGKMPWLSFSIPSEFCQKGMELAAVAGSVCEKCYTFKGNYHWPNVKARLRLRYELMMRDLPAFARHMAEAITMAARHWTPTPEEHNPHFRIHDSGDLQSAAHLGAWCTVAHETRNVTFADGSTGAVLYWLPTREYGHVRDYLAAGRTIPGNLCVRLSAHMVDGPTPGRYGLPVSSVHTDPAAYPDAHACPAYAKYGGTCGPCRACWDDEVRHVSYPKH